MIRTRVLTPHLHTPHMTTQSGAKMLPTNPAVASKYASQMMQKLAGEVKRLAPWGAPLGIFGA